MPVISLFKHNRECWLLTLREAKKLAHTNEVVSGASVGVLLITAKTSRGGAAQGLNAAPETAAHLPGSSPLRGMSLALSLSIGGAEGSRAGRLLQTQAAKAAAALGLRARLSLLCPLASGLFLVS